MKTTTLAFLICITTIIELSAQEIRIGIIGLDTSHSPAFVKSINKENKSEEFNGFRVTAAYPYGSKSIQSSYERIPQYTEDVKKYGVEIVESIADLLKKTDVILLETNDGNLHLEQALEVFKAGKRVFIDKPVAGNLTDAILIFQLAKRYNVPLFTSSSLRYSTSTSEVAAGKYGKVNGVFTFSPAKTEPSHGRFAWYGIHGIEALYAVMGRGCQQVVCSYSEGADVITGTWSDGRVATFRALRTGKTDYNGIAFCENKIVPMGDYMGYDVLLIEIAKFFKTGVSPIDPEETLELFTFMEAAEESIRLGGKPVSIEATYRAALKKAEARISTMK